tara:strand:- start:7421 stop:7915 length:495 start_codon:yes stop_codon:yes gene_type:complete
MKNIITILLLILTITSYGQTQLDKEIFRVVNEYRISNGLSVWVWNQDLFKVSEKHNYYQTQIKNVSHDESINIKGHVEVRRLGDRVSEGVSDNWECVGENLARVHNKDLTINEIAERVINGWINSPPHHKLLLSRSSKFDYGSVSSHPTSEGTYVTLNVTRLGN